ncbi:OmpP1/FadL family transporter [Thermodesulfobacteriota bacterium]
MKKRRLLCLIGIFSLFIVPAMAFGSGFAINENGSKAVGMGGAFAAQADDPTAVYFNPAGIVQLEGTQISVGVAPIMPGAEYTSTGNSLLVAPGTTYDADDKTFLIPNAYITHKFNDMWSFGFGTFSNFGLATEWEGTWEGRYIMGGVLSEIVTISLNPVVAYRPHQRVSIAAGPVLQYADVTLESKLPAPPAPDGDFKLTGDDWDWGWNVGLLVWLSDEWKFGASYRSEVKHSFSGAEAAASGLPVAALNQTSNSTEADITTPQIVYLALAWTTGPMTLEFDGQWTGWSSYDRLSATFGMGLLALSGGVPPGVSSVTKAKDWDDVWALRFGVNYNVTPEWDLRAGIIWDESPVPDYTVDPALPSGDRWLYCLGFGYHSGKFAFDFAYNYLQDEGRTFNNAVGDYTALGFPAAMTGEFDNVDAHIFSVNLSFMF